MNGLDDVWGDDEGAEQGGASDQLDREWQARREEHFSSGYREGLEAGKQETVQEGFDQGYQQGSAAGFECGAARGAAATLEALAARLPGLSSKLREVQQQQQQQQQGGGQQLAEMPFQQLQREVCAGLMAAGAGVGPTSKVHATVQAVHHTLQVSGLQPLRGAAVGGK
ncbi:hypothetical protein D9Q98_000545 [Chlorella vulgaris]|uniref:Essential protein Yae1 N-terminal domain-containing protein n=1 Tax=Chlorella vulgaris TaxID=3077 RepID=A0A9D4TYG3_CHLVU|nr:hypothetical protein D9Q98_000545 [Chlorella vulgaris]